MTRRLRDRLLWPVPAASARPFEDPELMARAALYLLGISGLAGVMVTVAFPPPGAQADPIAFAPAIGCLLLGAVVLVRFDRLPLWSLQALGVIARPRLAQRRRRPGAPSQPVDVGRHVCRVRCARARRERLPGEVLEVAPERAPRGVPARRVPVN